jgi:hypothetical protein
MASLISGFVVVVTESHLSGRGYYSPRLKSREI